MQVQLKTGVGVTKKKKIHFVSNNLNWMAVSHSWHNKKKKIKITTKIRISNIKRKCNKTCSIH